MMININTIFPERAILVIVCLRLSAAPSKFIDLVENAESEDR